MDHSFYLWMSFGATAIAVLADAASLVLNRARALRAIEEERALEAQD
jgi:heme exporter protein CcmD